MKLLIFGLLIVFIVFNSVASAQTLDQNRGLTLRGSVYRHYSVRLKKTVKNPEQYFRVVWIALEFVNNSDDPIFIPSQFMTQEVAFYDSSRVYLRPALYLGQTSTKPNIDISNAASTFQDNSRLLSAGERFAFTVGISICVIKDGDEQDFGCGGTYQAGSLKEADELLKRAFIGIRFRTIDFAKHFPRLLEGIASQWKKFGILPLNEDSEFVIESSPIENQTRTLVPEPTVDWETNGAE
jgi:hypothetical protein